jgi:hypothetical protein
MNIFPFFRKAAKSADNRPERDGDSGKNLPFEENNTIFNGIPYNGDHYLINAWVNIAVNILARNIARADFTVKLGGNDVLFGPLHNLFRRPNSALSRFDLWKETAAWWHIEGEAFWWFGPDYAGGLPKELYVLNPRKLRHEVSGIGGLDGSINTTSRRWFLHAGTELIPILS